jgi:pyruvate-ferredoxin/flavodoxin oxidoreductase
VAKFAASGKRTARKDLALQAIAYGNVYVAQVAMGANPQHTLQAFREAEAYPGPSLILAYSHCIAHGIDMRFGMKQQDLATASGYWPLFRFNPMMRGVGETPFRLDSPRPHIPLKAYAYNELRYSSLATTRPAEADTLLAMAQTAVTEKYRQYEELASRDGSRFHPDARHKPDMQPVQNVSSRTLDTQGHIGALLPLADAGQRHDKTVLAPGSAGGGDQSCACS